MFSTIHQLVSQRLLTVGREPIKDIIINIISSEQMKTTVVARRVHKNSLTEQSSLSQQQRGNPATCGAVVLSGRDCSPSAQ